MALVGDKSGRHCSVTLGDEITQRVEDFAGWDKGSVNKYLLE